MPSNPSPNLEVLIRAEQPADHDRIFSVNAAAFATVSEADLVNRLREQASPCLSLVAEAQDEIIGHIMFSPATLVSRPDLRLFGLGPMAVAPRMQRQGVGSKLVSAGLEECRKQDGVGVVVLGHPTYYPRFGFKPAAEFGLDSDYAVPAGVFMAISLEPGALTGNAGRVRYHPAFGDAP